MLAQGEGTFKDRATRLSEETDSDYVRTIVDFVLWKVIVRSQR